ncbi:uncharacterized protein NEMAJ01_1998 [Nematocida major]|uniref:uncharacterized protein n=1 Tax=Nematocida major TaxID=1912982 RepID=UPI002007AB19|nr:uncharacterized protein NEMAJ01_1998 [Nematocida major]KAH9387102.1 hypothetical protein NEMAJ01_1998 [Nematocida major]
MHLIAPPQKTFLLAFICIFASTHRPMACTVGPDLSVSDSPASHASSPIYGMREIKNNALKKKASICYMKAWPHDKQGQDSGSGPGSGEEDAKALAASRALAREQEEFLSKIHLINILCMLLRIEELLLDLSSTSLIHKYTKCAMPFSRVFYATLAQRLSIVNALHAIFLLNIAAGTQSPMFKDRLLCDQIVSLARLHKEVVDLCKGAGASGKVSFLRMYAVIQGALADFYHVVSSHRTSAKNDLDLCGKSVFSKLKYAWYMSPSEIEECKAPAYIKSLVKDVQRRNDVELVLSIENDGVIPSLWHIAFICKDPKGEK